MKFVIGCMCLVSQLQARAFDDRHIREIQALWAEEGRYQSGLPENYKLKGAWQVRLTVEGSIWLRNYSKLRGIGKTQPNLVATSTRTDWENWINSKIAWDRANASLEARKKKC